MEYNLKEGSGLSYRIRFGAGEVPPEDGAIRSAGVESGRVVECGGGCNSVNRRRARPNTSHGSALHGRRR